MKKMKSAALCSPCEERFEANIRKMVREGREGSPDRRQRRRQEAEAVFSTRRKGER